MAYDGALRRRDGYRPASRPMGRRVSRVDARYIDQDRRPLSRAAQIHAARPMGYSGGRRPPARTGDFRRRPPQRRRGVASAVKLALFALAAVLVVFVLTRLVSGIHDARVERFVDNVYVNGVLLSGYTHEEGLAVLAQAKEERLNTTYKLTYNDLSWDFTPSSFDADFEYDSELERAWNLGHVGDRRTRKQIINGLKQVAAEFNSEVRYDDEALDDFIDQIAEQIDVEPIDAEVTLTEEKPFITRASQNGLKLDKEATYDMLVGFIETGKGDLKLPVNEVLPTVASDDMEMRVVAKFTTDVSFRNSESRANVRLALSYFNCMAVYPGDVVDFNAVVGPRTEETGFKKAPEYAGNDTIEGVGGGVCQASTMLYNAVVMCDLTVIERHPHNMTVGYVSPSQDAAVEYGDKNFIFRNDTDHAYYFYTDVGAETATVTVYGTRPDYHYELQSKVKSEEPSQKTRYEDDTTGKIVYYVTDPPVLKQEGHGSCRSEGWIVAYDWNTTEEVSREQISNDSYIPGYNVYWRGIHNADGTVVESAKKKS